MDTTNSLLWIRVTTTRFRAEEQWNAKHEVEILARLETQHDLSRESPDNVSERWSPVFVVGDRKDVAGFTGRVTGTLWLLYDSRPVDLAARLHNYIPPDIDHGLFLTHGMASVLLLLRSPVPSVDSVAMFQSRASLRGIERWTIQNGLLGSCVVVRDHDPVAAEDSRVPPERLFHETIPQSVLHQIQDNDLVVRQCLTLCDHYRPSYTRPLGHLLRRSGITTEKILRAAADSPIQWEALQSDNYSLGHLNSMMAYLLSQGLGGRPPLLEHPGLVPSYSLFGVATAYQAIWAITHFIEEGFLYFDIMSEMTDRYFTTASADYRPNLFRPALDRMHSRPGSEENAPGHVNLFSGRLGFHSSTWAVAAPVDTLHEAADPAWNLLTLSHELLHIHVDQLLHFVLSPNPEREPSLTIDQLYLKIAQLGLENASKTDLTIIDRIRQKIARYVLNSGACGGIDTAPLSQLPRAKTIETLEITEPGQFRDVLVSFWKRLTEYLVHVLDFYYFYFGNVDRFVSLVVPSWATIPSVYDDIGHYIMRCLLTLSTREMNPDTGAVLVEPLNFEESLRTFSEALERLPVSDNSAYLVSKFQDFLKDPENTEFLRAEFNRAKPLVWTTVMYFYCRPLRLYFEVGKEVTGGMLNEAALCPDFELGGVQERLPLSPIAFLSKYLNSDYAQPDATGNITTEAASIWLFSWIASCGPPEGGQSATIGE